MLKAQLAHALQLPMDTRAEQGLVLLKELDDEAPDDAEPEPAATAADAASSPSVEAADRTCDRLIAMLRARLAAR